MEKIIFWTAGNVTYSENTFNTRILVEYKHTGKQFFYKEKVGRKLVEKYTDSEEIAAEKIQKGIKVTVKEGHYFIDRIAIPTINAKGQSDIWYINNSGDYYRINKVSKFWQKKHKELSANQLPL